MPRRVAAIAILLVVAGAAVGPIRSYDFFWHLATGRWIVAHRALPAFDPFTIAAAHVPWINGEWLWEVVAHCIPIDAMSWVNAIFVGAMFAVAFWFSNLEWPAALIVTAFAFAGASDRLGIRPAEAAAFLILGAIALLGSKLSLRGLTIAYAMLTIVWINVHPSALLAPLLAGVWAGFSRPFDRLKPVVTLASALALLVNPFGWRAIAAPIQLTQLAQSGEFVNSEWLPSTPSLFPLLYITAAAVIVVFVISKQKRESIWRLLIFGILAALAIEHVRNQGLYFAALPLLFAPIRVPRYAAIIAIAPMAWVYAHADHATGIDPERFPLRAVAQLQRSGLQGNIYNVDQFGGYLEWIFYPQRRVLTDGRNELFRQFIAEDARARRDSRAWHALLQKYRVALAVDEYQTDRIEVVDMATGERRYLPASLVRYRRRDWALIAFDDAAMIFARRTAFPPNVIDPIEYRYLVPDDPHIGYINDAVRNAARAEAARARREIGDVNVVRELERGLVH
ncbi:MAG TPA: hypothetical protein VI391_01760 [Thermoanaerobaculia bacterium]